MNHLQRLRELHTMYRDPKISSWYKTNEMVKWMDCDLADLILWMEGQSTLMRQVEEYMKRLPASAISAKIMQQEEPLEVEIRIEPCGEVEPVLKKISKYRRVRK